MSQISEHFVRLHVVNGCLDEVVEILNPQAQAIETESSQQGYCLFAHSPWINFDGIFPIRCVG